MVRWTETRDSYRATFVPDCVLFGYGALIILTMTLALSIEFRSSGRGPQSVMAVFLGVGALLLIPAHGPFVERSQVD